MELMEETSNQNRINQILSYLFSNTYFRIFFVKTLNIKKYIVVIYTLVFKSFVQKTFKLVFWSTKIIAY
jgi:hypothetical protein